VSVSPDTRVTHTLDVSKENVTKTLIVDLSEPVRTTSVLTPVVYHVAKELTAQFRTMLPSAGVPGALLEILSGTVGDSPEMKSVLPVEPTPTVRLDKTTAPFADASLHI